MIDLRISSKEASHILGVHESSIKRWCDGGSLLYDLTPGGHRRVSLDAVVKLGRERRIHSHLIRLDDDASAAWAGLEAVRKSDRFDALAKLVRKWLNDNDTERPFHLAKLLLDEGIALSRFLDDVLAPVLHEVGNDWAAGAIRIAEEHRMTALVVALLHRMARDLEEKIGPAVPHGAAVVACLPEVAHDLGALMTRLVLLSEGWKVYYLGPGLPLEDVADFQADTAARLVCLSVLPPRGMPEVRQALLLLARLYRSDRPHAVAVGGAGVDATEVLDGQEFERVGLFDSFDGFVKWLSDLEGDSGC